MNFVGSKHYSPRTLSVFEITGAYFANIFYNHLYKSAKDRHNISSGKGYSLTDEYKAAVSAFKYGVTKDKKSYEKTVKDLLQYYRKCTKFIDASMIEFIDTILQQFIPDEHFKTLREDEKFFFINKILSTIVIKTSADMVSMNFLTLIIDHREEENSISACKDHIVKIQCLERDYMFSKFIKQELNVSKNKKPRSKDHEELFDETEKVDIYLFHQMQEDHEILCKKLQEMIREKCEAENREQKAKKVAETLHEQLMKLKEEHENLQEELKKWKESARLESERSVSSEKSAEKHTGKHVDKSAEKHTDKYQKTTPANTPNKNTPVKSQNSTNLYNEQQKSERKQKMETPTNPPRSENTRRKQSPSNSSEYITSKESNNVKQNTTNRDVQSVNSERNSKRNSRQNLEQKSERDTKLDTKLDVKRDTKLDAKLKVQESGMHESDESYSSEEESNNEGEGRDENNSEISENESDESHKNDDIEREFMQKLEKNRTIEELDDNSSNIFLEGLE